MTTFRVEVLPHAVVIVADDGHEPFEYYREPNSIPDARGSEELAALQALTQYVKDGSDRLV